MSVQNYFNKSLDIACDLIRIDSVNPGLKKGAAGEKEIAKFIFHFLRKEGITVHLQEIAPERFNVIATVKGLQPGPRILLNGHLDTVNVSGMQDPFIPNLHKGKLFGRGSQDMKGGIAIAISALLALQNQRNNLTGEIILAAVADEEELSLGTSYFLKHWPKNKPFDFAIVLEPTDLQVSTAHKGFAWLEIKTFGKAAHGSRPKDGIDAIRMMGEILRELDICDQNLQQEILHPQLGCGSLHASLISGGSQWSSYPDFCQLKYERRTVPPETKFTVESEIQLILDKCRRKNSLLKAEARVIYARNPFEIDPDLKMVQKFYQTAHRHFPKEVDWGWVSFWTDAALLSMAGIPSIVFGPRGSGLHSLEEYVVASDLSSCAEIIFNFLMED